MTPLDLLFTAAWHAVLAAAFWLLCATALAATIGLWRPRRWCLCGHQRTDHIEFTRGCNHRACGCSHYRPQPPAGARDRVPPTRRAPNSVRPPGRKPPMTRLPPTAHDTLTATCHRCALSDPLASCTCTEMCTASGCVGDHTSLSALSAEDVAWLRQIGVQ